jgi:membrane-associated phospholipid phosphatase
VHTEDQPTPDAIAQLADVVSVASDFGAVWVLVSALQVLRHHQSVRSALVRLGAAGMVSLVLTRCLKHTFAVPRDALETRATLARTPSSPGFPSGHTLAAFTSALTIPATTRGRTLALAFASLVAWSRVRVGHHRTADVVAGAGAGALAGGALHVVLSTLRAPSA